MCKIRYFWDTSMSIENCEKQNDRKTIQWYIYSSFADWKMDWFVCIDKWENMTFKDVYFLQKSLGEDVFF